MYTIIIFIIILGLLVFVHEWGHFITAKKAGMKVYEFGFGFPPRAFGAYKDPDTGKWVFVTGKGKGNLKETVGGDERVEEYPTTLYSLNWLPLGGFVKIKGESGEAANDPDSFAAHPAWRRLVVLCAGVFMNFVLAAVVLGIGFMVGLPTDFSAGGIDESAIVVQEPQVMIQQVQSDSPAEQAGILFGDRVLRINETQIEDSAQMIAYVADAGEQELTVLVERPDGQHEVMVTPKVFDGEDTARIGLVLGDAGIIRFPFHIALWKGVVAAAIGLVNIVATFYILIKNLIIGQGLAFEVAGPVGIAVIVGESARLGFAYLLNITAMLSLSLAVINILPIPALDGGRALFVIIEKFTGKPVPMKYEQMAHTVGFVLLMLLIVVVTYRDIVGLF